jgi:signal transduction histidine kinase
MGIVSRARSMIQINALADYLAAHQESTLRVWRDAIKRDPTLATGDSLPKVQLLDHIPAILAAFESQLRAIQDPSDGSGDGAIQEPAAAHGLLRWQQGYDLREVTRELGKLNECVVSELERFTAANPTVSHSLMARAYALWGNLCARTVEESFNQYFQLQQQEAAGHVKDLEAALEEIRGLESQQADLWRQAAHDLRGNLSVVANATVGLTNRALPEPVRDKFTRMLMRNVTSLHQLLDEVTSLARLQAGREQRRVQLIDVTPILQQLCDGIGEAAQQRNLFLRAQGPTGFSVDGDPVKIARIAQNLIINAVKYTQEGGVVVSWGDSDAGDPKRWMLSVTDTGPGFHTDSGKPIVQALENANQIDPGSTAPAVPYALSRVVPSAHEPGEGIGLSIVKRLCELLDATIEIESTPGVGTRFRILFPRHYAR